ncbi:MAG: DUF2911 domain-containing protein [Bacteroidota bacterium]
MKRLLLLMLVLLLSQDLIGQYQIGLVPRVSPDKGVYQKIGYTDIEIKYGSPNVNNRPIWGAQVPYDKVWRAGANNATTIELSTAISFQGQQLEKGKYAFFILPKKEGEWLAIFNKVADQWGAFSYEEKEDALRVVFNPEEDNTYQEALSYSIQNNGFQNGKLIMEWEHLKMSLNFETNYFNLFQQEVESRVEKADSSIKWIVYLQGAEHLINTSSKMDLAKEWLEKSNNWSQRITDWNKNFYPREYIKGHLLWTQAKYWAAVENYQKAIVMASRLKKGSDYSSYYQKKKDAESIDLKLSEWEKKKEE